MARRRSNTEENITATTDGQGTINYQNNDLAARLARYRSRTGEYAKTRQGNAPSQGSNFTVPTAGQRTERKTTAQRTQAGQEYASRYRANAPQRKAQGAAYRAQEAKRRDEYANTGRVTTGVNPPRVYRPANQGAAAMEPAPASTYQQPNSTAAMGIQPQQRPSMFGGNNYVSSGQAYQPQSPLAQPQSPLAQPQSPLQPSSPLAQSYDPLSSAYRPPIPQSFSNGQAQYGPQPQYTLEEIMQLLQMMNGAGQPATPNNWGRRW